MSGASVLVRFADAAPAIEPVVTMPVDADASSPASPAAQTSALSASSGGGVGGGGCSASAAGDDTLAFATVVFLALGGVTRRRCVV